MPIRRRDFTVAALAATATLGRASAADATLRIGWLQAITGPNSAPGVAYDRGIHFAVAEINAAGGVNGRPIELITRDTQGDPTRAVDSAQELVKRLNVHAILGPSSSGETLAVTPIIARSRTPQIHAGVIDSLIQPAKFPNAYRTGASDSQWQGAANHYAVEVQKQKTVAIIADNTGYGTTAARTCAADLQRRGATVAYTGLVDLITPDLTAEVARARNAGATALLAWSASSSLLARLLNARGDLGWAAPVVGHPALGSGEVQHLLTKPSYWEGVYQVGFRTCCFDSAGKLSPAQAAFVQKIAGTVELKDTTLWWVAWGYDAVHLVADMVHSTGSTAPDVLIVALNQVHDYPGIFGRYSFTAQQHNGYPDADVVMSMANTFRDGAFTIAPGYGPTSGAAQ